MKYLVTLVAFVAVFIVVPISEGQRRPDRVILIQADDLGYGDLAAHGNPFVNTPNLDRLIEGSVQLHDFVVNPVCAPSRATLLTGRHFLRTGISHVHGGKDYLHRSEKTLADVFRESGWRTAMWGKWHSGTGPGYEPWERGFEVARRLQLYHHESAIFTDASGVEEVGNFADMVLFAEAASFLKTHQDDRAFLYLASMTPHAPLVAPPGFEESYRARGLSPSMANLYAMIEYMDMQVGKLVAALEVLGMLENTLIIFTSDNGPAINQAALDAEDRRLRKVTPLRGWKGDLWEGGVRAPCYLHWPAGLQPGIVTTPIDQADLFPTLQRWCGLENASLPFPLDGRDRSEEIESLAKSPAANVPIFNYAHPGWLTGDRPYDFRGIRGEYNPAGRAAGEALPADRQSISVRRGRYKLVRNPDQPALDGSRPERSVLIDLWEDPGEAIDLSASLPGVRTELDGMLDQWFASIQAEPHAFAPPVVSVRPNRMEFDAKLVRSVQGPLSNTLRGVFGWTESGSEVSYQLELEEAFNGYLRLHWNEGPTSARLRVSIGGENSEILNAPDWETEQVVHIPKGTSILRVELTRPPAPSTEALLERISLLPAVTRR